MCAEYGLVLLAPSSGLGPVPPSYLTILTLSALRLKFRGAGEGRGESSQEICSRKLPLTDSRRTLSPLLTTVVTECQASVVVLKLIVAVCLLSLDLLCVVVNVVPTLVRSWRGKSFPMNCRQGGKLMHTTALRSSMSDQTTTGTVSQEASAVGSNMATYLRRITLVKQELQEWSTNCADKPTGGDARPKCTYNEPRVNNRTNWIFFRRESLSFHNS